MSITNFPDFDVAGKNSNFFLEAGKGNIPGYAPIFFTGENEDLADTPETLMARGGRYQALTAATTLDVVSDDAADAAAGTGAQALIIFGLDANYDEISEFIVPNGTTPVTTTLQFLRVNAFIVGAFGSNNTNVGTVDLVDGANILAQILPDEGASRQAFQTVPAGHTWFPQGNHFSVGKADEVTIDSVGFSPDFGKRTFSKVYMFENQFPFRNENMVPFPEKFDVEVIGTRFSGTDSKAAVFTQFFEVDNNEF